MLNVASRLERTAQARTRSMRIAKPASFTATPLSPPDSRACRPRASPVRDEDGDSPRREEDPVAAARHDGPIPGGRLCSVSTNSPVLTAAFWRTRRAAAVAGIIFGVLLLTAMALARVAMSDTGYETLLADGDRREL